MKEIINDIFSNFYFLDAKFKNLPDLSSIKFENRAQQLSDNYKNTVKELLSNDSALKERFTLNRDDEDEESDVILLNFNKTLENGHKPYTLDYKPFSVKLIYNPQVVMYQAKSIVYSRNIADLTLAVKDKNFLTIRLNNSKNSINFRIINEQKVRSFCESGDIQKFSEEYNTSEKACNFIQHLFIKEYTQEEKELQMLKYDTLIESLHLSGSIFKLQ